MKNLSQNITSAGEHNVTFVIEGSNSGTGYLSSVNTTSEYGLVLIQEWWGMNKSITLTADTFAAQGFRVLCPDLYRGKVATNNEEAGHLMSGLQWDNGLKDVWGAMTHLKSLGCKSVGITGFCMGGAMTIAAAASFEGFKAAVPFYGIPDLKSFKLNNIKIPVLGNFGKNDQHKGFSDPEAALNLETQMKEAGVEFTLKFWDGADHAFMNQDSLNYQPEISKQALLLTSEFLKKHLAN